MKRHLLTALLLLAAPLHAQDPAGLAERSIVEAATDARQTSFPPNAPHPRLLIDPAALRAVFGTRVDPEAVIRAVGQGARGATRSEAVRCTGAAAGSPRSCQVAENGLHVRVDSLIATRSGYDVIVTSTFTSRRRRTTATGHRQIRISFARQGDGWIVTSRTPLRMS